MNRNRWTLAGVLVVVIASLASPLAAADSVPPGAPITLSQTVPVNIVFVGYEEADLDVAALQRQLPARSDPIVRRPNFYGLSGRELGLLFRYDYRLHWASQGFEDQFFGYLATAGSTGDPTVWQEFYNDQQSNVLDVTGPVRYIDGPATERTLEAMARQQLGIDTRRSYTIFFVNWYGRADFQFHLYTKTDEADPDTGYNWGAAQGSRKTIAWGGTSTRTWFYDLSAGPHAWTYNWVVDFVDLTGDGIEEYRMPPIWEYTEGGYREPSQLGGDLGLVARFVAINLLFTSSPYVDPLVTTPGAGGKKVAHIEMLEDDPASNGLNWIDEAFILRELRDFEPYYRWQSGLEDNLPIDRGAKQALTIAGSASPPPDCWSTYGIPLAQLYCYFDQNMARYVPPYGPTDSVNEAFAYNTTAESMGLLAGNTGFALDNFVDGTQTHVVVFDTSEYREIGYGFSATTIHEFGHHVGMSHPHDGYDSELDLGYGPARAYFFAWSGDESDSVMSYLRVSNGFGVFDRDNMYRYETAGYLNWANGLLDDILAHPQATSVRPQVATIQRAMARATVQFHTWDYLAAATSAYSAYDLAVSIAGQVGIETPSVARLAGGTGIAPHDGDPIRFPDDTLTPAE